MATQNKPPQPIVIGQSRPPHFHNLHPTTPPRPHQRRNQSRTPPPPPRLPRPPNLHHRLHHRRHPNPSPRTPRDKRLATPNQPPLTSAPSITATTQIATIIHSLAGRETARVRANKWRSRTFQQPSPTSPIFELRQKINLPRNCRIYGNFVLKTHSIHTRISYENQTLTPNTRRYPPHPLHPHSE